MARAFDRRFIFWSGQIRNSVKSAYIKGEMTCAVRRPLRLHRQSQTPVRSRLRQEDKRSSSMRPMRPFNFNTAAELFPAAIRKKKRAGFAYRRVGTAAAAGRFAL